MRSLARHPMFRISCQEASRLISRQMDEPLPFRRRFMLRLHLAYCAACTNVSRQFDALRRAMRSLVDRD
jgi:hypothetical protein